MRDVFSCRHCDSELQVSNRVADEINEKFDKLLDKYDGDKVAAAESGEEITFVAFCATCNAGFNISVAPMSNCPICLETSPCRCAN
jgi:rubrerythrin